MFQSSSKHHPLPNVFDFVSISLENVEMVANDSPLKSAIRANSSYKIREFEWFEVETKIRLFV